MPVRRKANGHFLLGFETPVSLLVPKRWLGMDSVLRRLKNAATMLHLHHSIYETAQSTPPLEFAD
jgi:hypothetical protein